MRVLGTTSWGANEEAPVPVSYNPSPSLTQQSRLVGQKCLFLAEGIPDGARLCLPLSEHCQALGHGSALWLAGGLWKGSR